MLTTAGRCGAKDFGKSGEMKMRHFPVFRDHQ
jgi:hypothetical protein